MYGDSVGSLMLYVATVDNPNPSSAKWSVSESQGNVWIEKTLKVSETTDFWLIFEGELCDCL